MSRRRRSPQERKTEQSNITRLQIGLVAGVAVLMVLAFIVLSQLSGQQATPAETASSTPGAEGQSQSQPVEQGTVAGIDLSAIPTGRTDDGAPTLGTPDAPVTIVEYSDYQCPHCQNFNVNVLPDVVKNYVTAGDVQHIHKNAAILGEESQWAAMAALCAADQGHFWEYNELLYNRQQGQNQGTFSRDNLKQFAAELQLDTEQFNQCLDQNKYAEKVVSETQEAQSRGMQGTPTFFINDEFVGGFIPFDQMKQIIDEQLQEASS